MHILKRFILLALFLALLPTCSYALNLRYDFEVESFGMGFNQLHSADNLFFYSNAGAARAEFTSVTGGIGDLSITVSGDGTVYENDVRGAIVAASSSFSMTVLIENALAIHSPDGIIGFSGVGARGFSDGRVSNLGDVTGDGRNDDATFFANPTFLNFAQFANQEDDFRSELAHLGSSNAFLWHSEALKDLVAKLWFSGHNFGHVGRFDGIDFLAGVSGELHLNAGQEVPEPATLALLGLGLIGGARGRKKS